MSDEKKVDVYSVGICYMSICAEKSVSQRQIEIVANKEHPTGIKSRWSISKKGKFGDGSPMPKECEQWPNRLHYLLNC
jgi:hypothetical protein